MGQPVMNNSAQTKQRGGGSSSVGMGSSSSSGGGLPPAYIQAYIDAKLEAVESRLSSNLDQKFALIEGKLGGLPQKQTLWGAVGTIVVTVFAAIGGIFGILSWAQDRIDGTTSAMAAVYERQAESVQVNQRQDVEITKLQDKSITSAK